MHANPFKLLGIPLVSALVIYFGGYFTVEHLRHRKGPWEVEFLTVGSGPALRVSQSFLGITNVMIHLADEAADHSLTNASITFIEPRDTPFPVPHGRVIFEDLTFLPGTVTFDLKGHGIELLPRTLILNGREHSWKSGESITLLPGEKMHPITPAEFKAKAKALKN